MKKIFFLLAIILSLSTSAQQLLKYNYTFLEAEEDPTNPGGLGLPVAPQPFKFDNYASFVNNLGGGFTVLPNIKFNGFHYDPGKRYVATTSVFFASSDVDSIVANRANQLYFPEASTFGLNVGFSKFLKKIRQTIEKKNRPAPNTTAVASAPGTHVGHRFSLNAHFFYLTKKMKDTLKTEATEATGHFVQLKLGFEWAIVKDNLSWFTNFNYCTVLTQRDYFRSAFNYSRNNYVFTDAGLQFRAELVEDKMDTYITLGSIIHSGDTRSLSGGTDLTVPYVKFGLNLSIK